MMLNLAWLPELCRKVELEKSLDPWRIVLYANKNLSLVLALEKVYRVKRVEQGERKVVGKSFSTAQTERNKSKVKRAR